MKRLFLVYLALLVTMVSTGCAKVAAANSLKNAPKALGVTETKAVTTQMKCTYLDGVTEYNYSATTLADGSQILTCNRNRLYGTTEIVVAANVDSVNGLCEIGSHASPDSTFASDSNGGMRVTFSMQTKIMTCSTEEF